MSVWSSRFALPLLIASLLAAAPGLAKPASDDPEDVMGGVCDATRSVGLCFYFIGSKYAEEALVNGNQYACKLFRGKFRPVGGKCPQPNRAGRCRIKHQTVKGAKQTNEALTILYYFPRHDVGSAQANCQAVGLGLQSAEKGIWVPE